MLISEAQILEVLRRQNSWWQTAQIPSDQAPPVRRLAFYEVRSLLKQPELKRAVILTGARRVGKTVILHQLAEEVLKTGVSPNKVLYVSFEDLTLNQANLKEILHLYEKNITGIDQETLILLDEIHYTADWGRWLMTIIREHPRARIVATGSAAVLLRHEKEGESGVGRWTAVHIPTLSFYEYIQMRNLALPRLPEDLTIRKLARSDEQVRQQVLSACETLQAEFNRYLLQGGFPATVADEFTRSRAQRFLREDVIDKALKRDMAHLYGARSLGELDQIFVYLCFNSGSVVEKNTLAKELGVAAATVENHLQRLEDAHLVYRLLPLNLQGKKSLKARPKVYIADPTLRNAVILRGEELFENETELGLVMESCIFKHLYAFYFDDRPRFGYWKALRGDKEVDFVLHFPNGRKYAFEVKYRSRVKPENLEGLSEIMSSKNAPEIAYVVTKNNENFGPLGQGIFQIPAYIFTYILGHAELNRWLKDQ